MFSDKKKYILTLNRNNVNNTYIYFNNYYCYFCITINVINIFTCCSLINKSSFEVQKKPHFYS